MNRLRRANRLRRLSSLFFAAGLALLLAGQVVAQDEPARVYVMPTSGIVDQIMAGYIRDGLAKADREGYDAVVIELNTPGGDLNATRDIVGTLLNSPVPVIVWVGPAGARAASAGTFITMAAHVATMAPGTNIGAATPITGEGQDIGEDLKAKILEDTNALLRSISSLRSRNVDWALSTVADARSYTAEEAVAQGGVDGFARTVEEAIAFADGRTVQVDGESVTLALAGAQTERTADEPAAVAAAPAFRPEHRLHPVHDRLLRPLLRAPEPELGDRHPGRDRDHPRLHRLRQPAAERRRPAADRARDRALRARVHRRQPRPA